MPPEIHPAIAKKIDELLAKARDLTTSLQQNLDILSKTLDLRDTYGLKMRAHEVADASAKLQWIAAQVTALKDLPYEMAASEMTGPRRRSSGAMPAVTPEKKDSE